MFPYSEAYSRLMRNFVSFVFQITYVWTWFPSVVGGIRTKITKKNWTYWRQHKGPQIYILCR